MPISRCLEFLCFPVDARFWAGINGAALDLLLGSALRIEAFRLAVFVETEDPGKVVDAQASTDARILIHPWFSGHSYLLVGVLPV